MDTIMPDDTDQTRHFRPDFKALPREQLEQMEAAGAEVLECYRVLRKTNDNIVGEVLRNQGTFYQWQHYPSGDVFDAETNAQYYYHAHPAGERKPEHGHFHTFLRPKGMPKGMRPADVPHADAPKGANDKLSHLIAISMDRPGYPVRLFTTNRWVTGEVWYHAKDVQAMLDRFVIDHARPSWPTNRWITAMVQLFRPQIEWLLDRRDDAVAAWEAANPDVDVYEDRNLEVTSDLEISVEDQLRAIRQALKA